MQAGPAASKTVGPRLRRRHDERRESHADLVGARSGHRAGTAGCREVSSLQAVLFDMDGTLCDSEPAWIAAEWAIAEQYDADWTQEDSLRLVGSNLLHAGAFIKQRMRLPLSPAQIVDEMLDRVIAWLEHEGVDWRAGALELVRACNDAGVPTALVTMSYRSFTQAVVDAMPVGRFDAVVTGDEVANGKPAPDPYAKAARELGVEAGACVAIEDSPIGAASARAAGCLVVVVPNQVVVELGPGMVERRTLAGVSVGDLAALVAER